MNSTGVVKTSRYLSKPGDIPVQKNESTNAIAQEVAELLKVTVTASDISTLRRLQTKNESKSRPIIVPLVSRDNHNNTYKNLKNVSNAELSNLSFNGVESILINKKLRISKSNYFGNQKSKRNRI